MKFLERINEYESILAERANEKANENEQANEDEHSRPPQLRRRQALSLPTQLAPHLYQYQQAVIVFYCQGIPRPIPGTYEDKCAGNTQISEW